MATSYHRFAGSSLDRLAALSDGVFAVAMTLLVLDLKAPLVPSRAQRPLWSGGGGGSEHVLLHGLLHDVAPRLLPYAMSFLTLGIFWVGQQTQLDSFTGSNRALTWIHLTFLLAVTLMPFSTGLLAQDTTYRLSMAVYWMNLFGLGVVLLISLRYADRAGLISDQTTPDMRAALKRRIVVYQAVRGRGGDVPNRHLPGDGPARRFAAQLRDRAADRASEPGVTRGSEQGARLGKAIVGDGRTGVSRTNLICNASRPVPGATNRWSDRLRRRS